MHSRHPVLLVTLSCLLWQPGLAQAEPVLHLSLDDAESIQHAGATSEGFAWFPSGVAGKAMGFDGIRTVVKVPGGRIPDLSGGFPSAHGWRWRLREIKPEGSTFPGWNPWTVTQIESGGRWAYATDRPSHSSLSHIYWAPYEQSEQGLTKIMLHGMTDGTATDQPGGRSPASWDEIMAAVPS